MAKLVVISPHLDDAVLSVGRVICGYPGAAIVTCFAGIPDDAELLTDYDRACGFTSSAEAVRARRLEDHEACDQLDCERVHLPFLDGQYDRRSTEVGLRDALEAQLDVWRPDEQIILLHPLGLRHQDHKMVANVARGIRTDCLERWVYEELPYRVLWPAEAVHTLALHDLGQGDPGWLADGGKARKAAAVSSYRSQRETTDLNLAVAAPERCWRYA